MAWSEIDSLFEEFYSNLEKAGNRIETARKFEGQTYHGNHKRVGVCSNCYTGKTGERWEEH